VEVARWFTVANGAAIDPTNSANAEAIGSAGHRHLRAVSAGESC